RGPLRPSEAMRGRARSLSPSEGERAGVRGGASLANFRTWWPKANSFEKKWVAGSVIAFGISLLGLLIYASCKPGLEQHLRDVGFPDPAMAAQIAGFSIREVGFFIVFLALTLGLLILVMSGRFAGPRARWGGILLGVLLVVDLSRANLSWI